MTYVKDITAREINIMLDENNFSGVILGMWGEQGMAVLEEIKNCEKFTEGFKGFLNHCTACGGDWGTMLCSGINDLYPNVYEAIPNEMGCFAFVGLTCVLNLLGINTAEEAW